MENGTKKLIDLLVNAESINEVSDIVNKNHSLLKERLALRGLKFYNNEMPHSQDVIGNQIISKKDIHDYNNYEEINFIRRGLETGWIENIDDTERFKQIEYQIKDILNRFF